MLAEIGRCAAPCAGHQSIDEYQPYVEAVRDLVAGHRVDALWRAAARLAQLSDAQRFEQAAEGRDRLAVLVRTLDRGQRLASLASITELVAARPDGYGGWDFAVVRHGRLASAGNAPRGVAPMPVVEMLVSSAETVIPSAGPLYGAPHEEVGAVLRWLEKPGTRMVQCTSPWTVPAASAASWQPWLKRAESAWGGNRPD